MAGPVERIVRKEILEMLQSHKSMFRAITVGRMSRALGHKDRGITSPQLRTIIRNMIASGSPIGSCNRGYFLITTEKERELYLDNLVKRRNGLSQRIKHVRNFDLK